jgi:rubrerythrin
MAAQPSERQYEYYEDEAVGVLEDALQQEYRARDYYQSSSQKRPWKKETKELLEWLAGEESKHAQLITEHLDEIKRRLAWIRYKPGPKQQ